MGTTHMKRIASPKTWPVERKESKWITKPKGAHKLALGLPLNVVFKEMLKIAKTSSEVKKILLHKTIMINGKKVIDPKRTFGILDILSVKETKESFTVIINTLKKLEVRKVNEKESSFKLSKIIGKKYLKNKKIQLNLHDGTNILIDKDNYHVGESIVIALPGLKIKEQLPLEQKSIVYIIGGKHTGKTGNVEEISKENIVCKIEDVNVELTKEQLIVIGKGKPVVSYLKNEK